MLYCWKNELNGYFLSDLDSYHQILIATTMYVYDMYSINVCIVIYTSCVHVWSNDQVNYDEAPS